MQTEDKQFLEMIVSDSKSFGVALWVAVREQAGTSEVLGVRSFVEVMCSCVRSGPLLLLSFLGLFSVSPDHFNDAVPTSRTAEGAPIKLEYE